MSWAKDILETFSASEGLRVAPLRADGKTFGTPTYIWVVASAGRVFLRAYSGTSSSWFQAALREQAGQVHVDGKIVDVRFAPVDASLNDAVDQAYRLKYASSRYLAPMVSARARAATVEILPA